MGRDLWDKEGGGSRSSGGQTGKECTQTHCQRGNPSGGGPSNPWRRDVLCSCKPATQCYQSSLFFPWFPCFLPFHVVFNFLCRGVIGWPQTYTDIPYQVTQRKGTLSGIVSQTFANRFAKRMPVFEGGNAVQKQRVISKTTNKSTKIPAV